MRRETADNDVDSDHQNVRREAAEKDGVSPREDEKSPRLEFCAQIQAVNKSKDFPSRY